MLPFAVLLLAMVYVLLDKSGVIDDFAESMRQRQGGPRPRASKTPPRRSADLDVNSRLEVFQNFIENLPSPDDEDEDAPS